jgi:hypothetical protein
MPEKKKYNPKKQADRLEKPSEDFIKQKKICKVCRSDYMREYYISNKDNQSKKSRERYIEKSEEIKMIHM